MEKFLILLCLISYSIFSQKVNINENSLKYYQEITLAEKLLYQDSTSKSISKYISTFENNGMLFFKDFTLSFQVARSSNDITSMHQLLKLLPIKFKTSKKLPLFFKKIKFDISSFAPNFVFKTNNNKSYIEKQLDSLFIEDQKDRTITYKKFFLWRRKFMKKWDKNSKDRIDYVKDIMNDKGLASEIEMGCDSLRLYHRKFYIILIHYPDTFVEFESFLTNWLNSGKMHPTRFALVSDYYFRHRNKNKSTEKSLFNYGYFTLHAYPKFKINKVPKEKIVSVNQNRKKIGLPSIQHDIKLSKYVSQKKMFHYVKWF